VSASHTDWSKQVPIGSPVSNVAPAIDGGKSAFKGDLVLARSIAFMCDALISREAAYAATEGDAGQLYEVTKVGLSDSKAFLCLLFYLQMMLFTFARCRGGLGVAAASGEARSTQGLLEVWQSSQGLGRLEELGRVVVVQSLHD